MYFSRPWWTILVCVLIIALANVLVFANPKADGSSLTDTEILLLGLGLGALIGSVLTLIVHSLVTDSPNTLFDSETIDFAVQPDNDVQVDAQYVLINPKSVSRRLKLVYPFPAVQNLSEPECLALSQTINGQSQALKHEELENAWYFTVDLAPSDTTYLQVRYRQRSDQPSFTYILTTTQSWGNRLHEAVFNIHLPADYALTASSYKVDKETDGDNGRTYRITEKNLLPEEELEFGWMRGSP